ncbi:Outer membrane protein TolC [bacterium A37T11]|nr:Outer membrane protein TolC [bacterium A37T11]
MKQFFLIIVILVFGQLSGIAQSLDSTSQVYPIDQLFDMAIKNNQGLKVGNAGLEVARQRVVVAKAQKLPTASATLTGGYLGNATVIDRDFSNSTTIPLPHFSNAFSLQANQMIFKGNAINNSIASATLQEQIASLNLQEDRLDIKLLVAGKYFDLYNLYNERRVYKENIAAAKLRLAQIKKHYEKGIVTRNDVIRSELQLANLGLAVVSIDNDIAIVNQQLTVATGLAESTIILPDTSILIHKPMVSNVGSYQEEAQAKYPGILAAATNVKVSEKQVDIAKADRVPYLSAYAGNNLSRPITSSSPAVDKYSNGWQVGLSLSYNIASLYNTPKNIKLNRLQLLQAQEAELQVRQDKKIAVNTAYIKHQEAIVKWETQRENVRLATENYRITEKKYLNQLALLIDMLDASNAKLQAELDYTNAEINIIYTYYQLQKETGNL